MADTNKKAVTKEELNEILSSLGLLMDGPYHLIVEEVVSKSNTRCGDILVFNGYTTAYVRPSFTGSGLNIKCTPIGVVVLGDEENNIICRQHKTISMSLLEMSPTSPNSGTTGSEAIYTIASLNRAYQNLGRMKTVGMRMIYNATVSSGDTKYFDPPVLGGDVSVSWDGWRDNYTGMTIGGLQYGFTQPTGTTVKYIFTEQPYENGKPNPAFFDRYESINSSGDTVFNPISLFNGKDHMKNILEAHQNLIDDIANNGLTGTTGLCVDWKTSDTIPRTYKQSPHASLLAWRFSTIGTLQGDWFIPSLGEAVYMTANAIILNNSLQYLIDSGIPNVKLLELDSYILHNDFYTTTLMGPTIKFDKRGRLFQNSSMNTKQGETQCRALFEN